MKRLLLYTALALFPFVTACGHGGNPSKKNADKIRVTELSDEEFSKQIYDYRNHPDAWKYAGTEPAIIDFYAPWCGPCRAVAPIMDELANEYRGRVAVYKVNVDEAQGVARALGIGSIPAVLFIPAAGEPQMAVGARPKAFYRDIVERYLVAE